MAQQQQTVRCACGTVLDEGRKITARSYRCPDCGGEYEPDHERRYFDRKPARQVLRRLPIMPPLRRN